MPQCPLYEEVLDTQMFGLSREIDFAVRLGLVDEEEGKELLYRLERELSALHDAFTKIKEHLSRIFLSESACRQRFDRNKLPAGFLLWNEKENAS